MDIGFTATLLLVFIVGTLIGEGVKWAIGKVEKADE